MDGCFCGEAIDSDSHLARSQWDLSKHPFSRKRFGANLPWILSHDFFSRGFVREFLSNEQGLVSWLGSFDETMFFRRVATRKVKETGPRLSISISCFVIQTPT